MAKFILKIAINSGAIYFASEFIDGFTFSGNYIILAGIGTALTIFQLFIYPVVKVVAFPIVILSFGLFSSIVNLAVLWGIAYFVPQLTIDGILPLILGAAVLSAANLLFSWL